MLSSDGFVTHGIDKSHSMIEYCNEKYENQLSVINEDAMNPLVFEPNSFSHVICSNFTVYEFENKKQIFTNVNKWLKHNGYFIVHLVDPNEFDTTIPAAKPSIKMNPQEHSNTRITKTHIDFDGFSYESNYVGGSNNVFTMKELFEDFETKQKRENEHTLFMTDLEEIERLAQKCGFHLHSKASQNKIYGGDKHQYIYIFEKIH